jgi:hypothetical protein
MEISEYLRKAIENDLDNARAEGFREAIETLRTWLDGIDRSDFAEDPGAYLDGAEDAIITLEGAAR